MGECVAMDAEAASLEAGLVARAEAAEAEARRLRAVLADTPENVERVARFVGRLGRADWIARDILAALRTLSQLPADTEKGEG